MGIEYDEAMETIHVIKRDGSVSHTSMHSIHDATVHTPWHKRTGVNACSTSLQVCFSGLHGVTAWHVRGRAGCIQHTSAWHCFTTRMFCSVWPLIVGSMAAQWTGVNTNSLLCCIVHPCAQVVQGTAALETLFDTVGLGWAVNLMELPIISKLVDLLYEFLSANRISLGNALVGAVQYVHKPASCVITLCLHLVMALTVVCKALLW